MPALAKVTLAQRQEIRRRRAAGEKGATWPCIAVLGQSCQIGPVTGVVRTPFQGWLQAVSAPGWTGRFACSQSLGGGSAGVLRSVLADRGRRWPLRAGAFIGALIGAVGYGCCGTPASTAKAGSGWCPSDLRCGRSRTPRLGCDLLIGGTTDIYRVVFPTYRDKAARVPAKLVRSMAPNMAQHRVEPVFFTVRIRWRTASPESIGNGSGQARWK
jgi:hypothetical protein